jgi:hypothetical protein
MKHHLILLLLVLFGTAPAFSQGTLQEFVIEGDTPPSVKKFYKDYGCTPDNGVIVFNTTIPDLEFSIPDAPTRLRHVSSFDKTNKCYVLCVQPTDGVGGYTQYSILVNGNNYKPQPCAVSAVRPNQARYFKINPNTNVAVGKELNFVFRGVRKKQNSTAKLYLDNQMIGEGNFKGFHIKCPDIKSGEHELRVVWSAHIPSKSYKINTAVQKVFEFDCETNGFGGYTFVLLKQ